MDAKITVRSKNSATAPHSAGSEDSGGSRQPCPARYFCSTQSRAPTLGRCQRGLPLAACVCPWSQARAVPAASPPQPCLGQTSLPPGWSHSGPAPAHSAMGGGKELGWGVRGSCQRLSRVSHLRPRPSQPGVLASERSGDSSSHPLSREDNVRDSPPGPQRRLCAEQQWLSAVYQTLLCQLAPT